MKKLYVEQRYTDGYLGDHTPDIEPHCYVVVKVINSITPNIRETLDKAQLAAYCESDMWAVEIK